jgi:TPR repeat protein
MNTNNNCNKDDYSMDNSTDAIGKLEGGTRDTNDISDDELFKPPPPKEECPICLLCLPTLASGSTYYACCGKIICSGCCNAPVKDNLGKVINEKKCPFCRTPAPYSIEDYKERLQKRVELDDAEAIFTLGIYYRDGELGLPQDYDKSLELFVRAGELGCAKAYCSFGAAYSNGNGVEIDMKKATHYYKLAAIRGSVYAGYNLGNNEQRAGNMNRALKHYMIAAEGGDSDSLRAIQKLYTNGHATKDDYAQALRAYQAYLAEIKSAQRDAAAAAYGKHYY